MIAVRLQRYIDYERGEAVVPGQEIHKRQLKGAELQKYLQDLILEVSGANADLDRETDLFDYG